MQEFNPTSTEPDRARPSGRYVSSDDIVSVLDLLAELRDLTLSRKSFLETTRILIAFGGADQLSCDDFSVVEFDA